MIFILMFDSIFYLLAGILVAIVILEAIISFIITQIYSKNASGKLLTGKEAMIGKKAQVIQLFKLSINEIYVGKVKIGSTIWTAHLDQETTDIPDIDTMVTIVAVEGLVLIVRNSLDD